LTCGNSYVAYFSTAKHPPKTCRIDACKQKERAEGRAEGRAEVRAEGRAEGRAEVRAEKKRDFKTCFFGLFKA
jgi:flagellar biosynthesis/type III secretory pathway protein FliH